MTIVAVGTSSPELFATAVAAYRNQTDIAVGNVIGSIASSAMVILALVSSGNNTVKRLHGALFVLFYLMYIVYVVMRG